VFEEVETRSNTRLYFRPFWSFAFHLFLGFPLALLAGAGIESFARDLYADNRVWSVLHRGAALVAGLVGFGINWKKRNIVAAFVFVLPLLFFWAALIGSSLTVAIDSVLHRFVKIDLTVSHPSSVGRAADS
jgi:hypothetical protein